MLGVSTPTPPQGALSPGPPPWRGILPLDRERQLTPYGGPGGANPPEKISGRGFFSYS